MKPFVFMCLTLAGLSVGLFVASKTDSGVSIAAYSEKLSIQQARRAIRYTLFSLGGAVAGMPFGWLACQLDKSVKRS
jgi:hypothetical protein